MKSTVNLTYPCFSLKISIHASQLLKTVKLLKFERVIQMCAYEVDVPKEKKTKRCVDYKTT